jgi:hypothetical protein
VVSIHGLLRIKFNFMSAVQFLFATSLPIYYQYFPLNPILIAVFFTLVVVAQQACGTACTRDANLTRRTFMYIFSRSCFKSFYAKVFLEETQDKNKDECVYNGGYNTCLATEEDSFRTRWKSQNNTGGKYKK